MTDLEVLTTAEMPSADTIAPQPLWTTTGVIKIKLGACLSLPSRRFYDSLRTAALLANCARNYMLRSWQRWHEDHPDWRAPQKLDDDGNPRFYRVRAREGEPGAVEMEGKNGRPYWVKNGEPVLEDPIFPTAVEYPAFYTGCKTRKKRAGSKREAGTIGFDSWLYHHGVHRAPQINSVVVPHLVGEVMTLLRSALPAGHPGTAYYRWQAILRNEVQASSFVEQTFPVPCNSSAIAWGTLEDGTLRATAAQWKTKGGFNKAVRAQVATIGQHEAILAFPLWSPAAGYGFETAIVRLEVRQIKAGQWHTLRRIANGTWRFADSELVLHDDEQWYLHLTYDQPVFDPGLKKDRIARVILNPADAKDPFSVGCQIDERPIEWMVGRGHQLEAWMVRLHKRREDIQQSYHLAGGGRRRHGRKRAIRDVRGSTRAIQRACAEVRKEIVHDCVRFALRHECGTMCFVAPNQWERDHSWFRKRKIPWDWTGFTGALAHQCRRRGIEVLDEC